MDDKFRAELRRIFSGPLPKLEIVEVRNPASHGWQRRPEFDRPGVCAWERPDGSLVGVLRTDRGSSQGS